MALDRTGNVARCSFGTGANNATIGCQRSNLLDEIERLTRELQRRSFAHGNVKMSWIDRERQLEATNRVLLEKLEKATGMVRELLEDHAPGRFIELSEGVIEGYHKALREFEQPDRSPTARAPEMAEKTPNVSDS